MKQTSAPHQPDTAPPADADEGGRLMMKFRLGDDIYELRNGSWSWRDENDLRQATGGLQFPRIQAEILKGNGSAFYVGCLVFLAKRGQGDPISFDAAQALVDYDIDIELDPDSPVVMGAEPGEGQGSS